MNESGTATLQPRPPSSHKNGARSSMSIRKSKLSIQVKRPLSSNKFAISKSGARTPVIKDENLSKAFSNS